MSHTTCDLRQVGGFPRGSGGQDARECGDHHIGPIDGSLGPRHHLGGRPALPPGLLHVAIDLADGDPGAMMGLLADPAAGRCREAMREVPTCERERGEWWRGRDRGAEGRMMLEGMRRAGSGHVACRFNPRASRAGHGSRALGARAVRRSDSDIRRPDSPDGAFGPDHVSVAKD